MFYNKVSKIGNELRKFGEIYVVKFISNKFKKKLDNHGKPMIFVGYLLDHPTLTYRMFDEDKKSIVITRDVVWLKKDYFEWKGLNKKCEGEICDSITFEFKNENLSYHDYSHINSSNDSPIEDFQPENITIHVPTVSDVNNEYINDNNHINSDSKTSKNNLQRERKI